MVGWIYFDFGTCIFLHLLYSQKWFNMWGKCTVLETTAMAWTDDNYLSTTTHTLYNQSVYISANMLHEYIFTYGMIYLCIHITIQFNIHVISGCLGSVRRWWENYPSWWSPVVHWHKMMAVARLESGIAVVSCESMPLVKEIWIYRWLAPIWTDFSESLKRHSEIWSLVGVWCWNFG